MRFILAGNNAEFESEFGRFDSEVRNCSSIRNFFSVHDKAVVECIGSWKDRKDLYLIEDYAKKHSITLMENSKENHNGH